MKNGLEISGFGTKRYWKDNCLHREDGPAVEWKSGAKHWFINGKIHREDGPAVEWADGRKYWYLDGSIIFVRDQKEFEKILKLKAFL